MIKAIIFDYTGTIAIPGEAKLFPGVPELLTALRGRGMKLALVSRSADVSRRRRDFDQLNLERYFEVIEVVPAGAVKDMDAVLARLGVPAHQTLVVGDYIQSEIVQGNKAGATTVWLRSGTHPDEVPLMEIEKPDHIITDLTQLWDILSQYH
jgi:phosphoglycolate phosphatase-like HAD superfamily hydrolase